jgi:hypothetical protein
MAKKKQKTNPKELNLSQKIRAIQSEIGGLEKNKEGWNNNYRYFDINDLLDKLMPLLQKYDVTLTQPIHYVENKEGRLQPLLKTILESGDEIVEYESLLPRNSDPQKVGSAITYFRRYSLQSLFCLKAEDDDAGSAVDRKKGGEANTAKGKSWD